MLKVHLRDINELVVGAWQRAFADVPEVEVTRGDIFVHRADAIVSPANSFGYMDGGIDLAYSRYFGSKLGANLRALLQEHHYGELPVGQAVVLETENASIPFLVSAPTMRVPSSITLTVNVYLAFRAALICVLNHNASSAASIRSLLVPGLGTGEGEVPPERAAHQMRVAYDTIVNGKSRESRAADAIWGEHEKLLS